MKTTHFFFHPQKQLMALLILLSAFSCQNNIQYEYLNKNSASSAETPSLSTQSQIKEANSPQLGFFFNLLDEKNESAAPQVSQYVRKIYQDKKGHIWFASNSVGVSRYDGDTLTYFSLDEGLSGPQVTGITEDKKGNIWLATSGGVSKYDGTAFTNFTTQEGLSSNRIWSIFQDSQGTIWVGTAQGLCRYNGNKFEAFPIPDFPNSIVRSMAEDHKGNLWLGTDGQGVFRFDGTTFTPLTKKEGLSDDHILSLLADSKGNIWIGTRFGGISRYDGQSYINYAEGNGIDNNEVCTIYEDKSGNIWFSAEGYGIYRFKAGVLTNFSMQEGLAIRAVQAIYEDKEGKFWVGGGDGLYRKIGDRFFNIRRDGPWDDC